MREPQEAQELDRPAQEGDPGRGLRKKESQEHVTADGPLKPRTPVPAGPEPLVSAARRPAKVKTTLHSLPRSSVWPLCLNQPDVSRWDVCPHRTLPHTRLHLASCRATLDHGGKNDTPGVEAQQGRGVRAPGWGCGTEPHRAGPRVSPHR